MKTISATLLRVQLRDLLADLDSGPVTITKHGQPVAVLSAPVEPVEASEAPTPEANPSEAESALASPPEAVYDTVRWATEESADPLDEFEQRDEDLDADFEAYLSNRHEEPDIEIAF